VKQSPKFSRQDGVPFHTCGRRCGLDLLGWVYRDDLDAAWCKRDRTRERQFATSDTRVRFLLPQRWRLKEVFFRSEDQIQKAFAPVSLAESRLMLNCDYHGRRSQRGSRLCRSRGFRRRLNRSAGRALRAQEFRRSSRAAWLRALVREALKAFSSAMRIASVRLSPALATSLASLSVSSSLILRAYTFYSNIFHLLYKSSRNQRKKE